MTGYDVDPDTLRKAATKIKNGADESKKVTPGELSASGSDFGNGSAADEFEKLMATWDEAISNTLKSDAEASAEKLQENAKAYEKAEDEAHHQFTAPNNELFRPGGQ